MIERCPGCLQPDAGATAGDDRSSAEKINVAEDLLLRALEAKRGRDPHMNRIAVARAAQAAREQRRVDERQ